MEHIHPRTFDSLMNRIMPRVKNGMHPGQECTDAYHRIAREFESCVPLNDESVRYARECRMWMDILARWYWTYFSSQVDRLCRLIVAACEEEIDREVDPLRITRHERKIATKLRQNGVQLYRNGWPDFLAVKDGKIFGVEVKRPGESPSADQQAMHCLLKQAGVPVFVVTDPQSLSEIEVLQNSNQR